MMNTTLTKSPFYFGASNYFYALLILLFLTIPAMLIWKRFQVRKGRIDPALLRRKKAAKEASRRLKMAKNLLEQGSDQKAFYKAVSDALEKYVADKFTIQTSELNKEKIRNLLVARQVDAGDIETYFEILQHCELALFGGKSPEFNHRIYEKADLLLQKMLIDLEKDKK